MTSDQQKVIIRFTCSAIKPQPCTNYVEVITVVDTDHGALLERAEYLAIDEGWDFDHFPDHTYNLCPDHANTNEELPPMPSELTIQHLRDYASSAPDSLPVPEKYEIADLLDAYDNLHALLTEIRGA